MRSPLAWLAHRARRHGWRLFRPTTVGVRALVLAGDGRVLLVRHSYTAGWYLPGGGVARGESVLDGLRRELIEEVGIEPIRSPRLLGMYSSTFEGKSDHSAPLALRDASGLLSCRGVAPAAGAAGGMASDAESLARWAYLLYGGAVLRPDSLRALRGSDRQGFGSARFEVAGEEAFGHPAGSRATAASFPICPRSKRHAPSSSTPMRRILIQWSSFSAWSVPSARQPG